MKLSLVLASILALTADFTVLAGVTGSKESHGTKKAGRTNDKQDSKSLLQALLPHQGALMKQMRKYQKNPPPLKGKTIPNTVLDPYREHKGVQKVLKECDGALVIPNAKSFDKSADGDSAGMSFIHFLVIPSKPIANIWSVESEDTVKKLQDCWHKFIDEGGDKKLMEVEGGKLKPDQKDAHKHLDDLKGKSGGHLKISDFIDFFHIPPSINYLHMHVVTNKAEYREHSSTGPDSRSILASNAMKVLRQSKPSKHEEKKEGGKKGGKKPEDNKGGKKPGGKKEEKKDGKEAGKGEQKHK